MNYINPPIKSPQNVIHKSFYSKLYNHEIGYNIYFPMDYESGKKYTVDYHFHGWTCNESTDIWIIEKNSLFKQSIVVFPNSSPVIEEKENLPVEKMIINEFIPFIEEEYKLDAARENRSVSGFSMGGGMAFYCSVKYPELFAQVIAYAGTYHHFYHKDYNGVGEKPEKAVELYEKMMSEKRDLEKTNILYIVRQNADKIRGKLNIKMHIGTDDILFCDNEIMHLYLDSLNISHEYKKFNGIGHDLGGIIL